MLRLLLVADERISRFAFARVYTHLKLRKKPSPLHTECVSHWFSYVSSVKAWGFQVFTSIHRAFPVWVDFSTEKCSFFVCCFLKKLTVSQKGWRLFRDVFFCNERVLHSDGRGTVCEIQVLKCECCEGFKIKAFTLETIENQRETRSMWKGEGFFRSFKCVYARARETPVFTSL